LEGRRTVYSNSGVLALAEESATKIRAKAAEYAPLLYICESKGTEERPH
jgi:hypothetical protein